MADPYIGPVDFYLFFFFQEKSSIFTVVQSYILVHL